ncbi:MAG: ABC transporter ATP-binding protein [Promethearchaeota archaeon]
MMLRIENLSVEIGDRLILEDFSLNIDQGEVHVLLGPNGSGKTTLLNTILGYPDYKILNGKIIFKGTDITNLPTHLRVQQGMGIVFQSPPKIPGVKLGDLLTLCGKRRRDVLREEGIPEESCLDISEEIEELTKRMNFSRSYLERSVNVGFSGGEVKRSEILQMMVLQPDFMLFDEPDSGVDVENVELIGQVIGELLERDKRPSQQKRSGLIITHLGYILRFIGQIDRAHVVLDGKIRCSGNPDTILNGIMKHGFDGCMERCVQNIDFELDEGGCVPNE